jgi:hypothetical protein
VIQQVTFLEWSHAFLDGSGWLGFTQGYLKILATTLGVYDH